MPIYEFKCDSCVLELEKVQGINEDAPSCPKCGEKMRKQATYPAMVKMKGEGGYPSRRKLVKGSAPFTGRNAKAWLDSDPLERHWLSKDARKRQEESKETPSRQDYK